jgi:hypothetical protein
VEHWQAKKLATIQTTTNLLVMTKKLVGYDLVTIQTHPIYVQMEYSLPITTTTSSTTAKLIW